MAGGSEDSFIQPLGLLLGLTALLALLLSYAGQSTIIAFILVGVIVNSLGVEPDPTTLGHISEVGILILLFMAGLEVDLGAFMKNWRTAAIVGVGQIACCTAFFAALSLVVLPAVGMDVTRDAAVYFGLCGCFSSTILVLGYLKNSRSMGTLHGQLCLGTLVLQDAASVLGIAVLKGLKGDGGSGIAVSILVLFGKLVAAMVIVLLLERFVLGRMFEAFARSLELLYLGSLGYATGLAALAVTAGFSGEITAFLAGVSISRLPYKMHIETKMEPIKSLGVAIFFISLGLGLELGREMVESLPVGFGLAVLKLLLTLPLFAALGLLARLKSHTVFMLGLLMNQISEFSLILCTLCVRAGVFEKSVLTVLTVAAVVSIVVSSVGHAYVDAIYRKTQRWPFLLYIDNHRHRSLVTKLSAATPETAEDPVEKDPVDVESGLEDPVNIARVPSLLLHAPTDLGTGEDWAFEDQLKLRTTEQLQVDLKKTEKELEVARESMAATADEKRLNLSPSTDSDEKPLNLSQSIDRSLVKSFRLYGRGGESKSKSTKGSIIRTSHATDIMHGMIEGYVVVDHELLFCTLRAGRALFWGDRHDVGHAPPLSVWDVSGMAVLDDADDPALDDDEEDEVHPWEWTVVLGHIHRSAGTSSIEDDAMKLAIHGLEDHSDHDAQDWRDALAVATSTLNPIALRLAHIREELHERRLTEGTSSHTRATSHDHGNEIICIGYNEMFPAVLALADAVGKEVVVVEYDPVKLNTIEKLYSEEQRRRDLRDRKGGKSPMSLIRENSLAPMRKIKSSEAMDRLAPMRKIKSSEAMDRLEGTSRAAEDGGGLPLSPVHENSLAPMRKIKSSEAMDRLEGTSRTVEDVIGRAPPTPPRPRRRVRTMSTPLQIGSMRQGFWASHASGSEDSSVGGGEGEVRGVKCEYADIHDPECWEELEMDRAFMLVCTIKGARHAEHALLEWLRRRESDAIFVACTQNNVEAMHMYEAGAHFVMQTDALAMRSTRDIFLETVANVGDCSQLVAAGLAHKKRLVKLEEEDNLKFQYETG